MKMLTSEITNLLDKLYNLRGEDSVILSKMDKEKEVATETKERTTAETALLQDKIEKLTAEETNLAEEGEKLVSALSKVKTEDFKTVLDRLNIDFNPTKISEQVNKNLPETIDKVVNETKKAKEELVKVEDEMNHAITTIEELGIRKDEAIANQKRLNEYFDMALEGNINITRDSITSLLKELDFDENEQREGAKILMFPEDALFEYDEKSKLSAQSGKSIAEVFKEAKTNHEEKVEELKEVNEEKKEEPVKEEQAKKLNPKEQLIELLKNQGFDYLEFTNNDINKVLANYDEDTLNTNVSFAKEQNIDMSMFIENAELLYDRDFKNKVLKLIEIGKEANDVYLNPRVLIKYSESELNNAIDKLKNSGLDPKNVPLMAY